MFTQDYIIANAKSLDSIFEKQKLAKPQLIITSPPYFDLLNYNNNKEQIGYGQKDYQEYLETLCKIFQDCYDLAKPDATFWLIIDTFKKNKEVKLLPFDIVNKLKENGRKTWILKDIIIWDKGKNLPWNNNGNFKNQHEYILFFSKSDNFKFHVDRVREVTDLKKWWKTYPERYNPDGKAPANVWSFNPPIRGWGNSRQNHLCPFPFQLVEKIISIASDENDLILDPFAGSGSVLAIANEMHRNSIGLDINKEYKKIFEKEVIVGANRYWIKRQKELNETKSLIEDFKNTNSKLRKLKVATNICEHLSKVNRYPFLYYTKNRPKNKIEIVVLQNGKIPKVDLNDQHLQELIKQSKIDAKVVVQKDSDFIANTKSISYKYRFDQFFNYTSRCLMKNIAENPNKYEYMYSDIAIKILNN
jgi:DNA modification methylase